MEKNNLNEALKEVREDILSKENHKLKTEKKLIFDGRQYSLRLPKSYVDEAEINLDNDVFEIVLELPDPSSKEKPKLKVELKRK